MPSDMAFRKHFGSWGMAIRAAGFEPLKPNPSEKCMENMISAHKGRRSFNWKGGKHKNVQGYIQLWMPDHPNSTKKGYVLEHRLIMSGLIGRPIDPSEDVHHINGIKDDNTPSNLQLIKKTEHTILHHKGIKKRSNKVSVTCIYPGCQLQTKSKHKMCRTHYKAQWQRMKNGLISKLEETGGITQ